jgi:hypothetical protein
VVSFLGASPPRHCTLLFPLHACHMPCPSNRQRELFHSSRKGHVHFIVGLIYSADVTTTWLVHVTDAAQARHL